MKYDSCTMHEFHIYILLRIRFFPEFISIGKIRIDWRQEHTQEKCSKAEQEGNSDLIDEFFR